MNFNPFPSIDKEEEEENTPVIRVPFLEEMEEENPEKTVGPNETLERLRTYYNDQERQRREMERRSRERPLPSMRISQPRPIQPKKPNQPLPRGNKEILVHPQQKKNPALNFLEDLNAKFTNMVPDFIINEKVCCVYLSVNYYRRKPEYYEKLFKDVTQLFSKTMVLCNNDSGLSFPQELYEIQKRCVDFSHILFMCKGYEEVGKYLVLFKKYCHKDSKFIKERIENDYQSKVRDVLTSVKSVNTSDCGVLLANFGSIKKIVTANLDQLQSCPGIGELKAKRLHAAFNMPFKRTRSVNRRR